MTAHTISENPIHLGLGATADVEPPFTGELAWYEGYIQRHGSDGAEGRLVAMHTFSESWDMWEMHPRGAEVVLCTAGAITLIQDAGDGNVSTVRLEAGEYAINAPGVWHTADVDSAATVLFITAGLGTEHRPR